jgi:hypothetical protein
MAVSEVLSIECLLVIRTAAMFVAGVMLDVAAVFCLVGQNGAGSHAYSSSLVDITPQPVHLGVSYHPGRQDDCDQHAGRSVRPHFGRRVHKR